MLQVAQKRSGFKFYNILHHDLQFLSKQICSSNILTYISVSALWYEYLSKGFKQL